jgi:hypothetical protein
VEAKADAHHGDEGDGYRCAPPSHELPFCQKSSNLKFPRGSQEVASLQQNTNQEKAGMYHH